MKEHDLKPSPGSHKKKKRIGRGNASQGTYSGKGVKGQKARSGKGIRPTFEGGQLPLVKALPTQRGFRNPFRKEYSPVNIDRLISFPAGSEVSPSSLLQAGIVKGKKNMQVKILGSGDLDRALTISAHKFSRIAREKIEAAGGTAREIS
jgi:large subunit ribosomal protein L15